MTHEALVRFAAGKVGGEVEDGEVLIRATVEIGGGHTCPVNNFYQLTSPELFLKGLGVYASEKLEVFIELDGALGKGCIVLENGDWKRSMKKFFLAPNEIPLTFWQCWAELEGRQG